MERLVRRRRGMMSLSALVAWSTALIIAFGMAVYAVFQYAANPELGVTALLLEHGWHVLVLGLLIYGVLYYVLHRKVVDPIHDLYAKCYAVAIGDFSRLELETNIVELRDIADGINLLIERMEHLKEESSLSELSKQTNELRSTVREAESIDEPAKENLMKIAERIDRTVTGLSAESLVAGGTHE